MAAAGTSPLAAQPATPTARWRQTFPGDERELRALRRWLRSVLPSCPALDDVVSVATELGANALRHTASGQGVASGGADAGADAAALERQFGVPVWIGQFTRQWWALTSRELVSAPSAHELATLLARRS